jgi:rhodanese-related sulfurtransferase
MPKTAAELVAEANTRVESQTPTEVADEVATGALLVDLREPEERTAQGVIPGAIPAPRGMLEFYADPTSSYHKPEFDPGRRVILHCSAGSRSALAADTLAQLGYDNVAHLAGGLTAWKEQGLPTEPAR